MINRNDAIRLTNVISKKYRFAYREMEGYLMEFMNSVISMNVNVKGPLLYSLHNVPSDEELDVEFFIPINEDSVELRKDFSFQSYFCIDGMISTYDLSNHEGSTEVAYAELLYYMEHNHLQQATPIFHVVSGDRSLPYTYIKIGVVAKDAAEAWK